MSSSLGDGDNIAVVDWTLAGSTELSYPRRLIWRYRAPVSYIQSSLQVRIFTNHSGWRYYLMIDFYAMTVMIFCFST